MQQSRAGALAVVEQSTRDLWCRCHGFGACISPAEPVWDSNTNQGPDRRHRHLNSISAGTSLVVLSGCGGLAILTCVRNCQYLGIGVSGAASVPALSVLSEGGCGGLMPMGGSMSFPLWKTAPARTRATRCGDIPIKIEESLLCWLEATLTIGPLRFAFGRHTGESAIRVRGNLVAEGDFQPRQSRIVRSIKQMWECRRLGQCRSVRREGDFDC